MAEISVSILSVNKENAITTFYNLETSKIDYFHIDVMDGKFVENENLELMKDYSLTISHISNIGLDVHLMVENVEEIMEDYISLNPRILSFHIEAMNDTKQTMNIIENIKENGIKVGIAINPDTSIESIKEFLPYIHQVLVMTVVPGKGGQKFIDSTLKKIADLKKLVEENNLSIDIEADGGINNQNASLVKKSGANILVSGSYIINSDNYREAIKSLKEE